VKESYGFTQKEKDGESGASYFETRFLVSTLGRFNRVDSLALKSPLDWRDDPQKWNIYSYCGNRVFSFVDSDGRDVGNPDSTRNGGSGGYGGVEADPCPASAKACIVTDMDSHRTSFYEKGKEPMHFESRNEVSKKSATGADSPYYSSDVRVEKGAYKGNATAYGPNDLLKTNDDRGRWLHGGGTGLKDPGADRQGWKPTMGCTRLQNEDIQKLVDAVSTFKDANPGMKIDYYRSNFNQQELKARYDSITIQVTPMVIP